MSRTDIRTDVLTEEQFLHNCAHYPDFAFFTPPEQFLFHHYDEPADKPLICHRPMVGIEKYVVEGPAGFMGVYDTRTVTLYLKTETWIMLPSETYFKDLKIKDLERQLAELRSA